MTQTVLVLGAGASQEVGLPIGFELKAQIAGMLNIRFDGFRQITGDPRIVDALRQHIHPDRDVNPHRLAACRIAAAMPQAMSIDNFIDNHRGDKKIEICGKLAIVQGILAAERRSKLYHDQRSGGSFNHGNIADTWFNRFLQVLTENCHADHLDERLSRLTLVVFNYDRCIEQYLYLAFQTFYGVSAERSAALVKTIHIYRPYGSVGALPWYGRENVSPFGHEPSGSDLLQLAAGIKTFTEGTDPESSDIAAIRAQVLAAERLIFLGFAFHRLNLEVLWNSRAVRPASRQTRCFATGKGISSNDAEEICRDLYRLGGLERGQVNIEIRLVCAELFQEYKRSLSLL